jgi:hypothetical protein
MIESFSELEGAAVLVRRKQWRLLETMLRVHEGSSGSWKVQQAGPEHADGCWSPRIQTFTSKLM